MINKLLREPLIHFLLLGAGLFVLFYQVADTESDRLDRLVVSQADIERLASQWQRQWKRPPSNQELNGMIESYIRESILYREALALGLDQDDVIVRRRLGQKLEFMFKDLAEQIDPSEEELAEYLEANSDRYVDPARYTFSHIYFNRDRRGNAAKADAQDKLRQLQTGKDTVDLSRAGDRFLYQYQFDDQSPAQISRIFGSTFARSLSGLDTGTWSGPVESGYGLHLVYIDRRTAPRNPPLDEIRDKLRWDVLAERRQQVDQAFYSELRKKYEVVIEDPDRTGEQGEPESGT